jgi:protein-disulfide isomerase
MVKVTKKETQARAEEATRNQKRRKKKKIIIASSLTALVLAVGAMGFYLAKGAEDSYQKMNPEIVSLSPERADVNGAFYVTDDAKIKAPAKDSTKSRVDMFFDPQCPGCGIVERGIGDRLSELSKNDEIDLFVTPVSFLDEASQDAYSTRSVNAVITVAEKSPENLHDFIHAIFAKGVQPSENSASLSDDRLSEIAQSVNVPLEVAETFKNKSYFDWIAQNTEKQFERSDLFPNGFSTPGVFINVKFDENNKAKSFDRVTFQDSNILKTFNDAFSPSKASNETKPVESSDTTIGF